MIKYFYKSIKDTDLRTLTSWKAGAWLYAETPTENELEMLVAKHKLELGHLRDALDPYEVPRLEVEDGNIYLFMRVPVQDGEHISTMPLLIVHTAEGVITIAPRPIPMLTAFQTNASSLITTQKVNFILQLFNQMLARYSGFLTSISRKVRSVSVDLHAVSDRDIIQFVTFERVLIDFVAALVPGRAMLNALLSGKYVPLYEQDQDLVEDLELSAGQIIENANADVQNMRNIREAYSTIMTNSLNRVIKLLTALTILIMVPTFVTSLFGMNVALPFASHPQAFTFIIAITFVSTIFLLAIFTRKRWL
ncbi:MAG: magnesium transporter CorA family protein [Patescibacteria group bacterium]